MILIMPPAYAFPILYSGNAKPRGDSLIHSFQAVILKKSPLFLSPKMKNGYEILHDERTHKEFNGR